MGPEGPFRDDHSGSIILNVKKNERKKILKEEGYVGLHEKLRDEIKRFTMMSNVFLSVVLEDEGSCEHILRILTGIKDLKIISSKTQYTISKTASHDARLDSISEDDKSRIFVMEIHNEDEPDAPRRMRFYGAMADSDFLDKGSGYEELPERYMIYISETDIWKKGRTRYHVGKYLEDHDEKYSDGEHILYVNAEIDDGSRTAKLMKYFMTVDPEDKSEGRLSERVHYLKCEEGGVQEMCKVTESIWQDGWKDGERFGILTGKMEAAFNLEEMGMNVEKIAEAVGENVATVREWLKED